MICENCKTENSGSYGSGRFCSPKCARGFSTKAKRFEINRKVSEILKTKGSGYIDGRDSIRENCTNCGKVIRPTKYHLCKSCLGTNQEFRNISSKSKLESYKRNPDIKRKISINNKGGRCKWYVVNGQKVQGTWEKNIAEKLTKLNIEWVTARSSGRSFQYKINGKGKTYTPDFYLPKLSIYLETKGFWWGNDKEKIDIIRNTYKNLNLIVLEKEQYENFLQGILPW